MRDLPDADLRRLAGEPCRYATSYYTACYWHEYSAETWCAPCRAKRKLGRVHRLVTEKA